ncbi:MAG: hypothetical protein JW832_12150 [Deltaproteobacteria bacterium]|nr:hypothetical protein [Deltaproteobacteria bacterium]
MHALYKVLSRIATLPALIIACVVFVSFTSFVLPRQKAAVEMYTREAGSPGLVFFPKPETVYKMAEAYGVDGRSAYIKTLLVYDFAWPLVYSFFYLVFIYLALGYAHNRKIARLSSVALLPGLFDWTENFLSIALLAAYPERMDTAAWVMAVTTCLKWITMGAASCLFVYGLAAAPVRYICGKQNTSRTRSH